MSGNMIGVRFRDAAKIYHFAPPDVPVHEGEYVVVRTAKGLEMGRVVTLPGDDAGPVPQGARPIVRLANADDRAQAEQMRVRGEEMLQRARALVAERSLPMYVAAVQLNLAGEEGACHFQADRHVDFTSVRMGVEKEFDVRLHMHHVGPRDRAKLVDGHDICGLRLCCSSWMTDFPKVGIRMAKEQSLALNPDKISGVCGRLLCCLTFEYPVYREMRGKLPKLGKRVSTPAGMGKVVQSNVIKQTITLELDDHAGRVEVPAVEIGMAVRVEEQPNAALEETLSDVLGREPTAEAAEGPADAPASQPVRRGGRPPRRARGDAPEAADGAVDGERPARRRRRRGRRGRRAGADEATASGGPEPQATGSPGGAGAGPGRGGGGRRGGGGPATSPATAPRPRPRPWIGRRLVRRRPGRIAGLALDVQDQVDLDGRAGGQCRDPDRDPRADPRLVAQDVAQQFGCAVDHLRLLRELAGRGDVAGQPDHAAHGVERAEHARRRRQTVDRALPGRGPPRLQVDLRAQPAAGDEGAVGDRELAGHVEQVARAHGGPVEPYRRGGRRQGDAEFLQAVVDGHGPSFAAALHAAVLDGEVRGRRRLRLRHSRQPGG